MGLPSLFSFPFPFISKFTNTYVWKSSFFPSYSEILRVCMCMFSSNKRSTMLMRWWHAWSWWSRLRKPWWVCKSLQWHSSWKHYFCFLSIPLSVKPFVKIRRKKVTRIPFPPKAFFTSTYWASRSFLVLAFQSCSFRCKHTITSKFRKPLDIGLLCSGVSEEEQGFVVEQPNLGRVPNGSCKLSIVVSA